MTHAIRVPPVIASSARVDFTADARATILEACLREGPQVVVCCWPAGAAYLPATCYSPSQHDTLLRHVEDCPVYADRRQLALFPTASMLLDAQPSSPHRLRPPLHVIQAAQPL